MGAGVAGMLAMVDGDRVLAAHITGPAPFPFGPAARRRRRSPARDRLRAERFNAFRADGLGYLHLQSTRPQTLGVPAQRFTGRPAGLDRGEVRRVDRPGGGAARPGRSTATSC